ncbi:MAG: Nramp family divalent metal transporter [Peptococcaceae bacterium]|jgi:NRAMP (natural resistance-associated macrophage protein)-like metal ion transporter|nr:Nramp family divalent metal transporter [Peptococcaceae bacterium]MDH7526052.1 Nramp family divalent metal transporter [Peptococcaceae bacterium]
MSIPNGNQANGSKNNSSFFDYLKAIGPGAIIAASIVGPGTVTTASVQGATYRYEAIWIIAIACIIAYYFQEPAIRITLNKGTTVLEGIREQISPFASGFLYIAVLMGGIAFQAGNFTGAAMALNYFVPSVSIPVWALTMSVAALIVSWMGIYRLFENINKVLIVMMVVAFLLTAFVSGPGLGNVVSEGFSFKIPGNNYWLVLALVATTVPPNIVLGYSAFLKKRYFQEKFSSVISKESLAKFDLRLNMFITLLITAAIIVCAGTVINPKGIQIKSAADMAVQLTPLLGRFAGILFSLGLWAAAFSSGLYQISLQPMLMNPAFGWVEDIKATRSRIVMLVTSIIPVIIVWIFKKMPVSIIITAQALNGLALPLVVSLVWILCNKKDFMQEQVNNTKQNVVYGIIMVLVTLLALRVFLTLLKVI